MTAKRPEGPLRRPLPPSFRRIGLRWYDPRVWRGYFRRQQRRAENRRLQRAAHERLRFIGTVDFYFTDEKGARTSTFYADFYAARSGLRHVSLRGFSVKSEKHLTHSYWSTILKFKSGDGDINSWRQHIIRMAAL